MTERGAWQAIQELDRLGVELKCGWRDGQRKLRLYPGSLVSEGLLQQIKEHRDDIMRIVDEQAARGLSPLVKGALALGARIIEPEDQKRGV